MSVAPSPAGIAAPADGARSGSPARHRAAAVPPRAAIASIIGFWLLYFAVVTLRAALMSFSDQWEMMWRRGVVTLVGAAITLLLYLALRPFARATLGGRIAAAALLSVPFAAAFASFNYVAFYVYEPLEATKMAVQRTSDGRVVVVDKHKARAEDEEVREPPLTMIADGTVTWYFFFVAWAGLHLAMGYAAEALAVERRAARYRAAAREAELRALRYQVNPHFLFNTLNSLSSLVLANRTAEAERMIMNLATFFRTSLAAEPVEDVPLADEIEFQRLYLAIEAVRFPERLEVVIDVPPALEQACVPGLILQPLVENALKHGVARTTCPVTLTIRARAEGGELRLEVADDAPATAHPAAAAESQGFGLRNVHDRIAARYGRAGDVRWGPRPDRGFAVTLRLPLVHRDCRR